MVKDKYKLKIIVYTIHIYIKYIYFISEQQ